MKSYKRFITGLLIIAAIMLPNHAAKADEVCNPNNIDTHYKGIYCGIRTLNNEAADEELVTILATQFAMSEDLIKEVLADTICETVSNDEEKKARLPKPVQDACLPTGNSVGQALGNWDVFTNIRNAYNKEKKIQQKRASLAFKFKVSEQYWDGQISTVEPDAPFDLIVDLNLIEIILFGSKATWMNDIYSFPTKEKKGDSEGGGKTPLDELLPKDSEKDTQDKGFEEIEDPGITVTKAGQGGLPPDCVLPDDPEADLGDGPDSAYKNPLCGNGVIDILLAEQCDDGNDQSGDGCNQYCQTEVSGSNDQCMDPEAVTFKKPKDKAGTNDEINGNANNSECPEGMYPKSGVGFKGQEAGPPQEVPQNPEYPGPFLGGTLKQFPASNRPLCGPGESTVEATVAGEKQIATDENNEPICLPTELCADFNAARDFLFGEGWEDDETVANIAPAIEALFCVNIKKENRPQSSYNLNEGCIDCHITAMADAVQKALETNVTPLKNTTSAFTTSSPYGVNFSFNLNTATKAKLKYKYTDTTKNSFNKASQSKADSDRKSEPSKTTLKSTSSPWKKLGDTAKQAEGAIDETLNDVRISQLSNKVISDQEVGRRINPLLLQMKDSFGNIESMFEQMVSETSLDQKPKCQ